MDTESEEDKMNEHKEKTIELLTGKTIKEIEVTGFGIYIKTTDGIILDYDSSDGGYSCWEIKKEKEENR